jgi:hypothetical protein
MTRRALRDRNRPDRIDVAEAIDRAVNGCTLPVAFSKDRIAVMLVEMLRLDSRLLQEHTGPRADQNEIVDAGHGR